MSDESSPDEPLPTRTEAEGATVDLPEGLGFFTTGQVLGDRYEILEMLGRGGMGEVWRAFDLKLRVEVGLKALREEFFQNEGRREMLRQEVRAAREVVSPNVCRIFDLIEIDGRELVSMEYVDGATLLGVLQERGPLDLKEAQDIASQFLAGLEAIHKAGLVHRDVKPENIMLTRAGRVVVMDFGLARGPESGAGSVSGTPAYMAPEHATGQEVDARADVYSAGVVLAEMVSPEGIKSYESRQSVWEGVRSEPAQVPDSPWAPVIKRAVAHDREQRQNSAHTLIRELEDVTLRVEGAEDLHPYPGLASFTEDDVEYFFGREAEVEQMWRKLEGSPRMLGLIGPSGAGKSSFIRAGVIPNAGTGWSIITLTPGDAAIRSLSQALASELAGDAEAMRELVDLDDFDSTVSAVSRWRQRRGKALLVVDQFEELFTLNASGVQTRFTELLGRFVLESDVFVLLSMRDDFFFNCHQFEALNPVVKELTLLGPPTGGALRRALVQPATKCGYRFEDNELVEEILAEVEGERGALPLLAFALARLWEKRDRDTGLLTRQAYHDIGGVGGALARHAEATVDKIGVERIPIVRELFRNLVTAEGTRAVREWDELLSIFDADGGEGVKPSPTKRPQKTVGAGFTPARDAAAEVLHKLINARLLTSYEVREDEHEPTRRVEIIHESLLANWPRLVRWQTQDQEGAQLRDELRQSARAWDEHGRHDDRLWTGTAYREFRLWRERYPGRVTETEKAFTASMTSFATRRKRRRRIATTAAFTLLLIILTTVGTLWQRSAQESLRAEAQKLLALGQVELDSYPTATVANVIASLELADSLEARKLAIEALWEGPTAMVVDNDPSGWAGFSSDGLWLVQSLKGGDTSQLRIYRADGTSQRLPEVHKSNRIFTRAPRFNSSTFATFSVQSSPPETHVSLWSGAEGRLLATTHYGGFPIATALSEDDERLLTAVSESGGLAIYSLGYDGTQERLGTLSFDLPTLGDLRRRTAMNEKWFGSVIDKDVEIVDISKHELSEPRFLGRLTSEAVRATNDPLGRFFTICDREGKISLWDVSGASPPIVISGPDPKIMKPPFNNFTARPRSESLLESQFFDLNRRFTSWVWSLSTNPPSLLRRLDLGTDGNGAGWLDPVGPYGIRFNPDRKVRLWPLSAPADADPLVLARGSFEGFPSGAFHPEGDWLATSDGSGLAFWPLARKYAFVIRRQEAPISDVVFEPTGKWVASSSEDSTVRVWPLEGEVPEPGRELFRTDSEVGLPGSLDVAADGERLLLGFSETVGTTLRKVTFNQGAPRILTVVSGAPFKEVSLTRDGRLFITASATNELPILDADSGEVIKTLTDSDLMAYGVSFTEQGGVISSGETGLRVWNLETGENSLLYAGRIPKFAISSDGTKVLILEAQSNKPGHALFMNLDTGDVTPLEAHGDQITAVAIDSDGTIAVTGDKDGVVRIGPVDGGPPHLMYRHEYAVTTLAVDPLKRWVASGGWDKTVRLWPMPDLSKPPLHTLPREELIAKLKTLTNLRVVRDPESATGWTLTHDPFPGWETVPTW